MQVLREEYILKDTKRSNLVAIGLAIFLAYLMYQNVISALKVPLSDFNGHTYIYLPMFKWGEWITGWKAVPYCLWHVSVLFLYHIFKIPLEVSAAYATIFFYIFAFFISYWIILRFTAHLGKEENRTKAAFIAFGWAVLQSIYVYWLDGGERFSGVYSMNPIHNPSQLSMRPFAMLCFCFVYDIWNKHQDVNYRGVFLNVEKGLKKAYIYLAIALFFSVITKPVFAEMFIPAVAFIMLGQWLKRILKKDASVTEYFKHCLHMFYCAIPALLYILLSFLGYFIFGGSYASDSGFVITKWMEVWSMFTENVALSILLGMAFPLFLVLLDVRFYFKDNLGKLALVGYVIGFLEAALLGEGGMKLTHGDFLWPMMAGMQLMFMASTLHLLSLENANANTKIKRLLIDMAWLLFCLHVFFGLLYYKSAI